MKRRDDVACLGPAGTYSEDAAVTYFGDDATRLLLPSLDAVFAAVESAKSQFGIVAVENSTEGSVPRTLDLLATTSLAIRGEMILDIRHALLASGSDLGAISCVRAHAQALAQCHRWLSVHAPLARREAVDSNAYAARMALDDPTSAAIASTRSAHQYGLKILFEDIQDAALNRTRFWVLGEHVDRCRTDNAKTSLIVKLSNEPGSLYRALEPFHRNGVSLCRLESRPSRDTPWEYLFYMDLIGHRSDRAVSAALDDLEKLASVKVLGSYPASTH